jgi:hypothetical protein
VELLLNCPVIPDPFRVYLHRDCDSPQQLDFRAHMLMHDSIYRYYFVVK